MPSPTSGVIPGCHLETAKGHQNALHDVGHSIFKIINLGNKYCLNKFWCTYSTTTVQIIKLLLFS